MDPKREKVREVPSKLNRKKPTLGHFVVKLMNTKNKQKLLKIATEKKKSSSMKKITD